MIGVGEDLSREKLCPVLGFFVARSHSQALMQARALLRFAGAGHSAAVHSGDEQAVVDYAAAVEVYRVVVNAPCSQGAAGFGTGLAPTFTVGTGFFGRSSVGENVGPQHLVNWTRIAWGDSAGRGTGGAPAPRLRHPGPLPKAPSDGVPGEGRTAMPAAQAGAAAAAGLTHEALREQIRAIVAAELRDLLKDER